MPQLSLSVQYADASFDWSVVLPRPLLRRWVKAALQQDASITLRLVDAIEAQTLNRDYRGKDYATNVLTFAYGDDDESLNDLPPEVRLALAEQHGAQIEADIVLCGDVLQREATAQGKTLLAHAAHLVVHGVLHAQGYDHLDDVQAEEMEGLERVILHKLSFADPYAGEGARLED
jgi:probable rRNA maturation factor